MKCGESGVFSSGSRVVSSMLCIVRVWDARARCTKVMTGGEPAEQHTFEVVWQCDGSRRRARGSRPSHLNRPSRKMVGSRGNRDRRARWTSARSQRAEAASMARASERPFFLCRYYVFIWEISKVRRSYRLHSTLRVGSHREPWSQRIDPGPFATPIGYPKGPYLRPKHGIRATDLTRPWRPRGFRPT